MVDLHAKITYSSSEIDADFPYYIRVENEAHWHVGLNTHTKSLATAKEHLESISRNYGTIIYVTIAATNERYKIIPVVRGVRTENII